MKHILLHELAHIFCTRNELGGDNFYERYCMDDTISREEDGTINAGYAVWRELAAELIAFELDDNCDVVTVSYTHLDVYKRQEDGESSCRYNRHPQTQTADSETVPDDCQESG